MKTKIVTLRQLAVIIGVATIGIGSSGAITPANALQFNFTQSTGVTTDVANGFQAAGNLWSSLLTDNVTVNINIDYKALDPGTLGGTSSYIQYFSYNQVYNALNNNRLSTDDHLAVNQLAKNIVLNSSNNPEFQLIINQTANSPNGAGSPNPYIYNVDANATALQVTTANAKALGLSSYSGPDAEISFSNLFAWDFDRSNGITAGSYDFVGVAAHEIGHALGFFSGVDNLDRSNSTRTDDSFFANNSSLGKQPSIQPLDLFRYSTDSQSVNAIDWTADTADKYFSLDGGVTKIASFATGVNFGDGRQASHWKDNLGLGIMDPTTASGELSQITSNDVRAFDIIGWDRSAASYTSVPEPSNVIGTLMVAAFGAKMVLKRRKRLVESNEKLTRAQA
jgi:hypothetical protein